ncbi:LytTR family DNA-binding domain-containing protein [Paraglaciecola aquimarina]|uniref:LytTR family DNA-binding domain-containing protein n=1 Tax=Paraglaciecola algarum TaxID=3050085 RepID=A0ABS9D7I8_9ALTE|nr:LytTR family DNA-binding domain-containing protein [Paraglaciecola sp. G1-23]MCF2947784.1 LytTR family DNA-binding domain-containing protein [Paraglaciecola sp. G1-23]
MFRCIVIEDEKLARERIVDFVQEQANWRVLACTGEYAVARELILKHRPDVCFMDINIIGGCGLDLVAELNKQVSCCWVFTTAYSEHALTAFNVEALDYLLKPYENSRLLSVLHKVEKVKNSQNQRKTLLAVKSVGAVDFVSVDDIVWIKGSSNYVELHCENKMCLHRETLSNLEALLDPTKFIRVHRSAMVNVAKISSLSSELGRFSLLHLTNGDEVKIGQGHKAQLFEFLGLEA